MRWVIRIWPGPSADGLDPHLAPNAAMPSMDPRMARHDQASRGSHAIRGWSMPSADGMDPRLAPNSPDGILIWRFYCNYNLTGAGRSGVHVWTGHVCVGVWDECLWPDFSPLLGGAM